MRHVQLTLKDGTVLWLGVGHMDPIETEEGIKKRLAHLGYYTLLGDDLESAEDGAQRYAGAVAAFQKSLGLGETGAIDDDTKNALLMAHGT